VKPSTTPTRVGRWLPSTAGLCALAVAAWAAANAATADPTPAADPAAEYAAHIRPILTKYCLTCHSAEKKKGDLNLDRFDSFEAVRKDARAWQAVWEKLEAGEMPPGKAAQPSPEERGKLTAWVRGFLVSEVKAHAGDPGRVVVRRLSNAEYDNTIRDLTGVDLRPTRDFPADGAAGEGFTNAGDALVMSPTLLTKYLNAAKEISARAVLLPDGFRFSPSTARRDWIDETVTELRKTYRQFDPGPEDGRLDFSPYLTAAIVHRDDLLAGRTTTDAVASQEKVNPKYLHILWQALTEKEPSFPLDRIRAHWRRASPKDVPALAAEIRSWQALLWKSNKIGSYMNPVWQDAAHPAFTESQPVRFKPNLAPGRNEVVLYLTARDLGGDGGKVVWRRPRFEGGKQPPLLLRDAPDRGGLDPSRFVRDPLAKADDANSLTAPAASVFEIRLPAALLKDREFVAEGALEPGASGGPVLFGAGQEPPDLNQPPGAGSGGAAGADLRGADPKRMEAGFDAFRRCFPMYLYHAKIVPDDEIICLRMFFREDDALVRLFLDDGRKQQLDRLWATLRWVSQEPLVEEKNYPQFLGFVSQDGPEPLKNFKTRTEEGVHQRAAAFTKDLEAAVPRQLDALLDSASRAYRRPLGEKEKSDLRHLYDALRKKEMTHEEAFRLVLTRVLASPAFLYRIEQPTAGKGPQPVSPWEQATRLSYFLWATTPDAELRDAAASGKLNGADGLTAQAGRMLKDPRTRGLATEFATQWLQVRDFQNNKEKNEKLFPTFDDKLRQDLFEETVLYFQDLFQNDRSVLEIVDSDHTFLDETLAKHYGVPNVAGPQWRRVEGVRQYGRGGVLTMGSILTTQSGASRTSPVLRGNWLVETLLGEKIPRPPPNVPRLPDEVTSGDELTVRQLTEKHTRVAECAVCHQRIDPYGFALEKYDPIGRLRDKDLGGRAIDCAARLRDGTQFNGVEGLRRYLLDQRKDDFLRHFCTKLLGYALGRSVALADQPLIDDMVAGLKANDYRVSVAIMAIIRSKQFRCHRDRDAAGEEEHP
jgi:mono/diheme cytochrome c family protein